MLEYQKVIDVLKSNNFDLEITKNELNCSSDELCNILINSFKKDDFLEIENLCVFGQKNHQILHDVSFRLFPNSFHIFIGENGAGKSTTIKTIIGQIENYKGNMFFNLDQKLKREKIFYVPDQQPKFPNVSIYEYLFNITKLLSNKNDKTINSEIDKWLERYGLENIKSRNVNKLSTGQKQKILIISSFLVDTPYIILDEPFANLDPTSRYSFMEDLKKFSEKGTSIFLSTHILEEIKDYATHATFIKKGRIINTSKVENSDFISKFYLSTYIENNEFEKK